MHTLGDMAKALNRPASRGVSTHGQITAPSIARRPARPRRGLRSFLHARERQSAAGANQRGPLWSWRERSGQFDGGHMASRRGLGSERGIDRGLNHGN